MSWLPPDLKLRAERTIPPPWWWPWGGGRVEHYWYTVSADSDGYFRLVSLEMLACGYCGSVVTVHLKRQHSAGCLGRYDPVTGKMR